MQFKTNHITYRRPVLLLSLLIFSFSYFAESIEVLDLQIQSQYEDIKLIPGRILPTNISELAFEIPGKVAVVNSDLGDFVGKGEILAKLDDSEINANFMKAEANFMLAQLELDRFEDLKENSFISSQDFDEANAKFLVAKSEFELNKVKLAQTYIRAPYDGFIQQRYVDVGTIINPGITIFDFVDSSNVEAHVSIPGNDLNGLSLGSEYEFEINGETHFAIFSRIAPMTIGGSSNRLGIFEFSKFLSPGNVGYLKYRNIIKKSGAWVPLQALSESNQGLWNLFVLEKLDDGYKVLKEIVELHHVEDEYAYISGTISNGDQVVVGGALRVIEGQFLK